MTPRWRWLHVFHDMTTFLDTSACQPWYDCVLPMILQHIEYYNCVCDMTGSRQLSSTRQFFFWIFPLPFITREPLQQTFVFFHFSVACVLVQSIVCHKAPWKTQFFTWSGVVFHESVCKMSHETNKQKIKQDCDFCFHNTNYINTYYFSSLILVTSNMSRKVIF